MLNDIVVRLIRTWVPGLVGLLVAIGLPVSPELEAEVGALIFAAYYAAAAWLESRFEWAGWLLGIPKTKTDPRSSPTPGH